MSLWEPHPDEAEYYSLPCPSSQHYTLPTLFPSLLSYASADKTWGRSELVRSPNELRIMNDVTLNTKSQVVMIGEGESMAYDVWEKKERRGSGAEKTLIYLHGLNDYGGKFAEHAGIFLEAGYRVIVIDLPGHGRSSGLHAYLPSLDKAADAVHSVLIDIQAASNPTEKLFLGGASLGGLISTLVCIKYGGSSLISGGLLLCPALLIQSESRPSFLVESVARFLSTFAGSAPIASANRGKNSEDAHSEQQFERDPQTYHRGLRVATGLGILSAVTGLGEEGKMGQLELPFLIAHGTKDRVTNIEGSRKLWLESRTREEDKIICLYEGFEHILLRKGKDEEDDQRRQTVLADMLKFLDSR